MFPLPVVLAFNCVGPVAEEHYLLSDMSVLCYKGDHVSAMVVSAIFGVLWAFAAPAAVTWMGGWRPETHTDPRFKFLFGKFVLTELLLRLILLKRATMTTTAGGRLL